MLHRCGKIIYIIVYNLKFKRKMKRINLFVLLILATCGFVASCTDDDFANGGIGGNKNSVAVKFGIGDIQNEAQQTMTRAAEGATISRAAFMQSLAMQGIAIEDLTTQELSVDGTDEVCLLETTVAGVNPVQQSDLQTRANISTAITENFSTLGYCGETESSISNEPWFYNEETNKDGVLTNMIVWKREFPYGKFFGISPQIKSDYAKLKLSPKNYTGTPYVDFEVESDVKNQKDLLVANSGIVQFEAPYEKAPVVPLKFYHALTAIHFKVGQNLSWNKTITKVDIVGAKTKGRYTLPVDNSGNGGNWAPNNETGDCTLDGLSVSTSKEKNAILTGADGDNYTFYMIPQDLENVSVVVSFSDGSTLNAMLKGKWQQGTTVTYSLSEKNSNWEYVLTANGNAQIPSYSSGKTYDVTSYRKAPDGTQQAVPWKITGYDANGDGNYTFEEKPEWFIGMSLLQGDGGTSSQQGWVEITANQKDLVPELNEKLKSATPLGSVGSPYDLSTQGGKMNRHTANCYVISAPGSYCIPLVYGNAIKNGMTNEHSYKTSVNGKYILSHFVDHEGKVIESPYINVQNSTAPAQSANMVWTDAKSTPITNLTVTGSRENSYVNFDVPADKIEKSNTVIAIKDKDGKVMWSWHLWIAQPDVLKTTEVTCKTGQKFDFIQEPLGYKETMRLKSKEREVMVRVEQTYGPSSAKQSATFKIRQLGIDKTEAYATYYQHSRKDAFKYSRSEFPTITDKEVSIANGIQNPDKPYEVYMYQDIGFENINLWSMDFDGTTDENKSVKTIYDPCPAGFKVPERNAFTGFTTTGEKTNVKKEFNVTGSYDYGWNFNNKLKNPDATFFIPAAGYQTKKGQVERIGSYWLCDGLSDSGNGFSYYFEFNGSHINPQNTHLKDYMSCIFPVAE